MRLNRDWFRRNVFEIIPKGTTQTRTYKSRTIAFHNYGSVAWWFVWFFLGVAYGLRVLRL